MSERKVFTLFIHGKKPATNPGDRYLDVYQEEINKKTGEKKLIKTGVTCVYDMIQADLEQSKIENILHSVAMGDLSVLNQREGFYIDATEYPHSLMEAQNIVINAQNKFNEMPEDFRELFHNNSYEYLEQLGTEDYEKKVKPWYETKAATEASKAEAEYKNKVTLQAKYEKDVAAAKGVEA